MAWTYRATGVGDTAGAASLPVTKPTGLTAGDLMVCFIESGANSNPITVPSGWALLVSEATAGHGSWIYWKIADSTDVAATTFTWTWSLTGKRRGSMSAFYGLSFATTPLIAGSWYFAAASAVTRSIPSVTTSQATQPVILFASSYSTAAKTHTQPTTPAYTEHNDTGNLNSDMYIAIASYVYPTSGTATGAISYPTNSASTYRTGIAIRVIVAAGTAYSQGMSASLNVATAGVVRGKESHLSLLAPLGLCKGETGTLIDNGMENGTNGAALNTAAGTWIYSYLPPYWCRYQNVSLPPTGSTMAAETTGAVAAYGSVSLEADVDFRNDGAEVRFWLSPHDAAVFDTGKIEVLGPTASLLSIYIDYNFQVLVRSDIAGDPNGYVAATSYPVMTLVDDAWYEFRMVMDFTNERYLLFVREHPEDAWTSLYRSGAPNAWIPNRYADQHRMINFQIQCWDPTVIRFDEVRISPMAIVEGPGASLQRSRPKWLSAILGLGLTDTVWYAGGTPYTYGIGAAYRNAIAQGFKTTTAGVLDQVKFSLAQSGAPTGTCVCKIYASTGTPNANSTPTGTALATSDTLNVNTFPDNVPTPQNFQFSGANRIKLEAGTQYFASVEYPYGDADNYLFGYLTWGNDYTDGNAADMATTTWASHGTTAGQDEFAIAVYVGKESLFTAAKQTGGPVSQALYATVTLTSATMNKIAQRYRALTAGVAFTPTITRAVGKKLAAGVTLAASIRRAISKPIAATLTLTTAAIAKGQSKMKSLPATLTLTAASLTPRLSKILTATVTLTTATIARITSKAQRLTFQLKLDTVTIARASVRRMSGTLTLTTATITRTRVALVNLFATLGLTTASLRRAIPRTLTTALSLTTVALTRVRVTLRTMPATLTLTAVTLGRAITKRITATVTLTGVIRRQISKSLTSTLTLTTAAIRRVVGKRMAGALTLAASLARTRVTLKSLPATLTLTTARLQRAIGRRLAAGLSLSATIATVLQKAMVWLYNGRMGTEIQYGAKRIGSWFKNDVQ